MAKILTDKELAEIVSRAISDPGIIDDKDQYIKFLEGLGDLVADHFGGERSCVEYDPSDRLGFTIAFLPNDSLPSDGGIYREQRTYGPNISFAIKSLACKYAGAR